MVTASRSVQEAGQEGRRREREQALAGGRRRTWVMLAAVVVLWAAFQLVFYFVVPWLQ